MRISANLGERFELRDFNFSGEFVGTKITLEGVINKGNLRYIYSKNGEETKDIIEINNDISLVEVVRPFVLKNLDLEKGKSYTLPVSNPFKELLDSNIGFNKSVGYYDCFG